MKNKIGQRRAHRFTKRWKHFFLARIEQAFGLHTLERSHAGAGTVEGFLWGAEKQTVIAHQCWFCLKNNRCREDIFVSDTGAGEEPLHSIWDVN